MMNTKREVNNYIHFVNSEAGWEQAYTGGLERKLTVKEWSIGLSGFLVGLIATVIFFGQFFLYLTVFDLPYDILFRSLLLVSLGTFVLYIISYIIISRSMGNEESSRFAGHVLDVTSVFLGLNSLILLVTFFIFVMLFAM